MAHIIDLKNKTLQNQPSTAQKPQKTEFVSEIKWSAPEFEKKEKSKLWFIIIAIIISAFIIIAFLYKNYTFISLLILSFICIYIYAKKEPRTIDFSLTAKGVTIEDKIYAYQELKSFWIFYDPPRLKTLSLQHKKFFMPHTCIPIANQNPSLIRAYLLKYIPEIEQEESLLDIINEKIGL